MIGCVSNQHHLIRTDPLRRQALIFRQPSGQAKIKKPFCNASLHAFAVALMNGKIDLRMLLAELLQRIRKNVGRRNRRRADGKNTVAEAGTALQHPVPQGKNILRKGAQFPSLRGNLDPPRRPHDKPCPQLLLQLTDMLAHGWLGKKQILRRIGKASGAHNLHKRS